MVSSPPAADASGAAEPDAAQLQELERRARSQGTGLTVVDLQGTWLLQQVWPRQGGAPSALTAILLRGLGACLRIEASSAGDAAPLRLTNAVRLGPLELRFQGPGWLQGRRPLLLFRFESLELRAGRRSLWSQALSAQAGGGTDPRRQPFFALIATGPQRGWMAARGRSGGLAVWHLSPPPG